MRNGIRDYIKENIRLILISFAIIFAAFGFYLFRYGNFVLGYDFQYQHLLFHDEFNRLVKSGQMPFWSKNMFLGGNFYSSKSYYILGDPFAYLALLFSKENMTYALMFTYVLKFLTATLLFNELLKKMGIHKETRTIGSLMYGFCGWASLFMEHPNFLVWHTFLPLLLLGVERVLKDNKYTTFILGVFFIAISNYYFFFTTSVFLTIYWTTRYFQLNLFDFKKYFFDTLKLIGFYLIGVLMSSVILIPSVLYLTGNSRVGSSVVITNKWNPISIYLDMIVKSFIPSFRVNELGQTLFNTTDYNTNQLSLYSSVFTIVLLPQIFKHLKDKEMKGYFVLLCILFIFICFPIFSSIMHGFNTPNFRWTLLFITVEVLTVTHILDKDEINRNLLIFSVIAVIILIGITLVFANKSYDVIWEHLKPEYNALIIAAGLALIYSVLYYKKAFKLLLVVLVIELTASLYRTTDRYPDFQSYQYNNLLSKDAIDYIKSLEDDNSFYRIYVPYQDGNAPMPHNTNYYYDYMSAYTYDSLLEPSAEEFAVDTLGFPQNTWPVDMHNPDLFDQLCFKYFITTEDEFVLGKAKYNDKTINLSQDNRFELLAEIDGYKIYRNNEAKSFPIDLEEFRDNRLSGTITSTGKEVVLPISFDGGWKITIDGDQVTYQNRSGFIAFETPQGKHEINMTFCPSGFVPSALISLAGIAVFTLVIHKEKK